MKIKDLKGFYDDDLEIKVSIRKLNTIVGHIVDVKGIYSVINQDTNKKSIILEVVTN
jgi:hypothetical protein